MYRRDEHGSNRREPLLWSHVVCAGKWVSNALWSRRNPWTAGYTQPIFRQNELFAVVPPIPPPLFLRLMRACYAVGYVGREGQLAEGWKWNYKRIPRRCIEKRKFWIFFETNWDDLIHRWTDFCTRHYALSYVSCMMIDCVIFFFFFNETTKHDESYIKILIVKSIS